MVRGRVWVAAGVAAALIAVGNLGDEDPATQGGGTAGVASPSVTPISTPSAIPSRSAAPGPRPTAAQPAPKRSVKPAAAWVKPPAGVPAGVQAARVTRIVDGDTLVVAALAAGPVLGSREQLTVRLLEVDTPERGQPYARKATAFLHRLAPPGATVWVVHDVERQDRYGRELLYVWTKDGRFVNREIVRHGLGTAVLYEPNDRYIEQLRWAEQQARKQRRGLWAGYRPPTAQPVAPRTQPAPAAGSCDPSYPDFCLTPGIPDLDCGDIEYRRFRVRPPDPRGFDGRDDDGIGCESD